MFSPLECYAPACSALTSRDNAAIVRSDENPEAAIRRLLAARGWATTVCPSEVARALAGPDGDWRTRMGAVHAAVDTLVERGAVALSWKGRAMRRRGGPYRIGTPR